MKGFKQTLLGTYAMALSLSLGVGMASHAAGTEGAIQLGTQHVDYQLNGEVLVRYENWDWFGNTADAYDFQFLRARINAQATWEDLTLVLQPQWVAMDDVPDDAALPAPAGPSGMGGLYYLHNKDSSPSSVGFHQAYIQYGSKESDFRLKAGRFTYASGLEHMNPADGVKFNTLKTMRLGDRLISSFEWSAFARSFDGVRLDNTLPGGIQMSATWMYPTQGGWEEDFNETMDDVRIASLAVTLPKDTFLKGTELGFFAHNYQDERDCVQRVDNSGTAVVPATDIDVSVVGLHAVGIQKHEQGQFDYLLWGNYQWGDWYEQDHRAYAIALEAGFQWTSVAFKPWLRVGWFHGSGDDDASDGDHNTFFQLAPGTRKYQLFPYYDLQNIEYEFAQLFLFLRKDLKLRMDYSVNRLAESADRWYMGTGPTQLDGGIFGYIGRPSSGESALSKEASVMLMYEINEHMSCNLFYAHAWGDDVIQNIYADESDADYFSIETTFKF